MISLIYIETSLLHKVTPCCLLLPVSSSLAQSLQHQKLSLTPHFTAW